MFDLTAGFRRQQNNRRFPWSWNPSLTWIALKTRSKWSYTLEIGCLNISQSRILKFCPLQWTKIAHRITLKCYIHQWHVTIQMVTLLAQLKNVLEWNHNHDTTFSNSFWHWRSQIILVGYVTLRPPLAEFSAASKACCVTWCWVHLPKDTLIFEELWPVILVNLPNNMGCEPVTLENIQSQNSDLQNEPNCTQDYFNSQGSNSCQTDTTWHNFQQQFLALKKPNHIGRLCHFTSTIVLFVYFLEFSKSVWSQIRYRFFKTWIPKT